MYALLHEAIYCENVSSNWAAERVGKVFKEFQWLSGYSATTFAEDQPLFFAGEMIYPFLFKTSPELRDLFLVAEKVALFEGWPQLYNLSQLNQNTVPLYAATYIDDMYVDFELAQKTIKNVKNHKQFITNNMYHNALGCKTSDVLQELFSLRDDTLD